MLSTSAPSKTNRCRQLLSENFNSGLNEPTLSVVTGWRRVGFLVLAAIAFGCSLVGIVLPGIPATPFLLLTSYLLLRSSRRLHERLLASRLFGDLLSNWQQHRGLRRSTRAKAIALTLVVVTISICLSTLSPVLLAVMLSGTGIGVGVILSVPVIEN